MYRQLVVQDLNCCEVYKKSFIELSKKPSSYIKMVKA